MVEEIRREYEYRLFIICFKKLGHIDAPFKYHDFNIRHIVKFMFKKKTLRIQMREIWSFRNKI